MTAFAYYRLPCEQHATYVAQHVGEPEILSSVAQLNGKEGFVIAPFQPSAECPVVLIHPDEKRVIHLTGENFEGGQDEKKPNGGQNGSLKDENGGLKGEREIRGEGRLCPRLRMLSRAVAEGRVPQDRAGTQVGADNPPVGRGALRQGLPHVSASLRGISVFRGFWHVAHGDARGAAQWACGRVPHHVACRHSESAHDIRVPHPSRGDRGPGVAAEGPGGAAVRHRLY